MGIKANTGIIFHYAIILHIRKIERLTGTPASAIFVAFIESTPPTVNAP